MKKEVTQARFRRDAGKLYVSARELKAALERKAFDQSLNGSSNQCLICGQNTDYPDDTGHDETCALYTLDNLLTVLDEALFTELKTTTVAEDYL
ncbi:MAG: hypothetical protein ABIK08_04530 [Pseudomonadota bacterium]